MIFAVSMLRHTAPYVLKGIKIPVYPKVAFVKFLCRHSLGVIHHMRCIVLGQLIVGYPPLLLHPAIELCAGVWGENMRSQCINFFLIF